MSTKEFENKRWENFTQSLEFRHRTAISLVEGKSILDVGCGDGLLLKMLSEKGFNAEGADISDAAIEKCLKEGFLVKQILNNKLPFPDNSFDTVIALDVLEHLYDPQVLLDEIKRVSKKNIIIGVPNFSSLPARMQMFFGKVPENNLFHKGHVYWFNLQILRGLINQSGLITKKILSNTVWENSFLLGFFFKNLKIIFPNLLALSFVAKLEKDILEK